MCVYTLSPFEPHNLDQRVPDPDSTTAEGQAPQPKTQVHGMSHTSQK